MKNTLRVLTLSLLLILLCSASALAAEKGMTISYIGPATLTQGQSAKVLSTKFNTVSDGTVVYSLTDMVKKTVVYTETKSGVKAGQEIQWTVPYYAEGMSTGKPVKQIMQETVLPLAFLANKHDQHHRSADNDRYQKESESPRTA